MKLINNIKEVLEAVKNCEYGNEIIEKIDNLNLSETLMVDSEWRIDKKNVKSEVLRLFYLKQFNK